MDAGCTRGGDGPVTDGVTDDTDDSASVDDTGEVQDFAELPVGCAAPDDLGADTLELEGSLQISQDDGQGGFFIELVDLEKHGDLVYGTGQGGTVVFDVSDLSDVTEVSVWPPGRNSSGRYHRVEHVGDDVFAMVHRDSVLEFIDYSDPTLPAFLTADDGWGREGLAAVDDRLYVSDRSEGGQLQIWDVSDPSSPVELTTLSGFPGNVWELAKAGDGWLYAADQGEGVVPIDLSDPDAPAAGEPVAIGPVLHVDVDGDHLYAAMGSLGVAVLERSDPAAPTLLTTLPVAGSAVQVSASGGFLFAADHEGLMAWDVSDPANPVVVAHEESEQFALAVISDGDTAWLGDWSILGQWKLTPGAPEMALSNSLIQVPVDGGHTDITLTNWGQGELRIVGGTAPEGMTLETRRTELASGQSTTLRLSWEGGDLDSTICLASNDPDGPAREVSVVGGDNSSYLGQTAPDFTLTDLDGNTHRLSEQLGNPVVLAYFATW